MREASQLPGRGPTIVDIAPVPYLHINKKSDDDDDLIRVRDGCWGGGGGVEDIFFLFLNENICCDPH